MLRHLGVLTLLVTPLLAQEDIRHHHELSESQLGTVHFQTSCSAGVAADFNHAIALLHSFEYDEARDAFSAILTKDPSCAMAQWGIAMSYFHGLWGEFDAPHGRAAADNAQKVAAANPATTGREKAYIEAIAQVYRDEAMKRAQADNNKPDTRGYNRPHYPSVQAFADKMAALHAAYPDDVEAAIFNALALDIASDRRDKTHAGELACGRILEPLFKQLPNHPGIAHYLIHCNDNPDLAAQGLAAAREYARIAPASAHATHMPSHIFVQLGLWDESIASNRASMDAAVHATAASTCERAGNTLHAMHFLAFGLVQTGRLREARDVVDQALAVPKTTAAADQCDEDPNVVLASYVAESADWERGKSLTVINKGPTGYGLYLWSVIGIAAANRGNLKQAQEAQQNLLQIRDDFAKISPLGKKTRPELMRLEVAGWMAEKIGRADEAIEALRSAAELEDALGGLQTAVLAMFTSAHQMYGQVLLLHQQPKSALVEFEEVLKRSPNRFNAVYGAASAADALGDTATAARYYRQLTQIAHGDERPELVIARQKLASTGKVPSE